MLSGCSNNSYLHGFPQNVEEKITNVLCFVGGGWMIDQSEPDVSVHIDVHVLDKHMLSLLTL